MLSVACMSLVFFLRNLQPMLTRTSCKFTFRLRHGVHFQGQDKKNLVYHQTSNDVLRDLNKSILNDNNLSLATNVFVINSRFTIPEAPVV